MRRPWSNDRALDQACSSTETWLSGHPTGRPKEATFRATASASAYDGMVLLPPLDRLDRVSFEQAGHEVFDVGRDVLFCRCAQLRQCGGQLWDGGGHGEELPHERSGSCEDIEIDASGRGQDDLVAHTPPGRRG